MTPPRFTRYTKHEEVWLLHAQVSPKFKEWHEANDLNKMMLAAFCNDPTKMLAAVIAAYSAE